MVHRLESFRFLLGIMTLVSCYPIDFMVDSESYDTTMHGCDTNDTVVYSQEDEARL